MKKKICLLVALSTFIVSNFSVNTYAYNLDEENIDIYNNIEIYDYVSKDDLNIISEDDVPDYIVPMEFSSDEEAIEYINSNLRMLSDECETDISTLSTDGDVFVDSSKAGMGTLTLRANYGTTGDSNTGTITYINPYVTHTGYTMSIEWKESNKGYNILSNNKDAYIYANGVLDHYLLINGFIKLFSTKVSLSNTVFLAR